MITAVLQKAVCLTCVRTLFYESFDMHYLPSISHLSYLSVRMLQPHIYDG